MVQSRLYVGGGEGGRVLFTNYNYLLAICYGLLSVSRQNPHARVFFTSFCGEIVMCSDLIIWIEDYRHPNGGEGGHQFWSHDFKFYILFCIEHAN